MASVLAVRRATCVVAAAVVALAALGCASAEQTPTEDVVAWADALGSDIASLQASLHHDEMAAALEAARDDVVSLDPDVEVANVVDILEGFFQAKFDAVEALAAVGSGLYKDWVGKRLDTMPADTFFANPTRAGDAAPDDLAFDPVYGAKVSFAHSTVAVPAEVQGLRDVRTVTGSLPPMGVEGTIAWTAQYEDLLRDAYEADESLRWLYFGSVSGVHRKYPGAEAPRNHIGFAKDYDPRLRPWFLAATTGPKDVVLVLDASKSMKEEFAAAKSAAKMIARSLSSDDFVSLLVQHDGADAYGPLAPPCFSRMTRATPTAVKALIRVIDAVEPAGWTNFGEALFEAYNVMSSSVRETSNCGRYIVYFTDGYPSDAGSDFEGCSSCDGMAGCDHPECPYDDYANVVDDYAHMGVTVFSYVFGRGVDDDDAGRAAPPPSYMACSTCAAGQCGQATYFQDDGTAMTDNMRGRLSNWFDFFSESASAEDSIMTSPYIDSGGKLGLMLTVAKPVRAEGGGILGVIGADSTLDEVETLLRASSWGNAYYFLVSNNGETYVHPLLKASGEYVDSPDFVDISLLETDDGFRAVRDDIVAGKGGTQSFTATRTLPAGGPSDGVRTYEVSATYTYAAIAGTPLVVGLVTEDLHDVDYREFNGTVGEAVPVLTSYYHRTDLYDDPATSTAWHDAVNPVVGDGTYRHRIVSLDKSGVKVAPTGFCDSLAYLTKVQETVNDLEAAHNALNAFDGDTRMGGADCDDEDAGADVVFKREVVNAARVTSFIEAEWLGDVDTGVIWRYVSTPSGMHRAFPGHGYDRSYDARTRAWYNRALAFPDSYVLSTPYVDASGAGRVITLSQAVTVRGRVEAVMGVDVTYSSLHDRMLEALPAVCTAEGSTSKCMVIDSGGLLVYHPDFAEDSGACTGYSTAFECDSRPHCAWAQDPLWPRDDSAGECHDSLNSVHLGQKEGSLAMHLLYEAGAFERREWKNYKGDCVVGFASTRQFVDAVREEIGARRLQGSGSSSSSGSGSGTGAVGDPSSDLLPVDEPVLEDLPIEPFPVSSECTLEHVTYALNPAAAEGGAIAGSYSDICGSGAYTIAPIGDTNLNLVVIDDYVSDTLGRYECAWVNNMVKNSATPVPPGCDGGSDADDGDGDDGGANAAECPVQYRALDLECEVEVSAASGHPVGGGTVTLLVAAASVTLALAQWRDRVGLADA